MTRRRWLFLALCGLILGPPVGWATYAAVTWLTFAASAGPPDPLLERYMPSYDVVEVHETRVAAPASITYSVVRELDLQQSGVIRAILRSRELMLGGTTSARPSHFPMVRELVSLGWGVLEEIPGRAMVFGSVTRPWEANVTFRSVPPASYAGFDSAGFVKIVVTLAVDSLGPRTSTFRTETRAQSTDPTSREKFRRYWSVVSPGILLIRSEALRLVRRESARAAGNSGGSNGPILSLFLLALAAFGFAVYRNDLGIARKRARSRSTVRRVRGTSIEYATLGQGSPVLVLHGTGGGWDQGLALARGLISHGFRIVAPSRFGYLRTPLPLDPSPQAEADTWVHLLDALGIEKVPVIAASAAAAPAVQLALRHPDRVSALILFVPGAGGFACEPAIGPSPFMTKVVLQMDFPFWLAMRWARKRMYRLVAVPPSLVPSLSASERAELNEAIERVLPVTSRRRGILNDAKTQRSARQYELNCVTAPTLVLSAQDDLHQTLVNARIAASLIPHARLIEFKTGGHLLLGHADEVWPMVAHFIRAQEVSSGRPLGLLAELDEIEAHSMRVHRV